VNMEPSSSNTGALIRSAFASTPYPGDDRLVTDDGGRDPETRDVAKMLSGQRWDQVSLDTLRARAESLPLLTPEAFRYYLPAYMLGVFEHWNDVDVVRDSVLYNLTPPNERSGRKWEFFRTRADQFTPSEGAAIASFLRFMSDRYQADWAASGMTPPTDRVAPALRYWDTPR
jgi:hypothetical protein